MLQDYGTSADPGIFAAQWRAWDARMERALASRLPDAETPPARLHAAMRYSVQGGSARVRAALLFATARTVELREDEVEAAACALELMHAYARVHDALVHLADADPCDLRPACHEAYDEATAILVGDALPPLAFQLLADDVSLPADPEIRLRLVELLARAGGAPAITGGARPDGSGTPRYARNAGALIGAAVRLAAACAPSLDAPLKAALEHYAGLIGIAVPLREDAGALDRVHALHAQSLDDLAPFGARAVPLRLLTDWLLTRETPAGG